MGGFYAPFYKEYMSKTDVICSNFVSIYDRFSVEDYGEHDTMESAVNQLLHGEDAGMCMPIAVIDIKQRKMVWFHDFIGKQECEARVGSFLKRWCDNFS